MAPYSTYTHVAHPLHACYIRTTYCVHSCALLPPTGSFFRELMECQARTKAECGGGCVWEPQMATMYEEDGWSAMQKAMRELTNGV